MPFAAQHIRDARNHLRKHDPVMRSIIQSVGPFTAKTHRNRFKSLAMAIVSQQISGKAAKTIWERLENRLAPEDVTAAAILNFSIDELRDVGVSRQKAGYLNDLAIWVDRGQLQLNQMGRKSDEEVIKALTQVKGIGRWTAQMFLIFTLARLDILPVDDLGIRSAIKQAYELPDLPSASEMEMMAKPWRPYASVASWYLWQSLDSSS